MDQDTETSIKSSVTTLLKSSITPFYAHCSQMDGSWRPTNQLSLLRCGEVAFDELEHLFLPGEMVFTASATPTHDLNYEQCWIVESRVTSSKASLWDYKGPALWEKTEGALLDESVRESMEPRKWKHWNAMLEGRVVVDPDARQEKYLTATDVPPEVLKVTEEMSDQTYLICSGRVRAKCLSDLRGVFVAIDELKPVEFQSVDPNTDNQMSASAEVASLVESFVPLIVQKSPMARPPLGKLFVVRYELLDAAESLVETVAESIKRPCLRIDLLDFEDSDISSSAILQKIVDVLRLAVRLDALVCLRNFAPLLAKRSFKDRQNCRRILNFIRAIGAFPGTTFICLHEGDETDVEFDRLNPRELSVKLQKGVEEEG
ncbi:hypothetical protein CFIO01_02124 [Colletotrichum fioriniae PJ7]|uniref:Uncharacterized protein n=1 Tax=Colletotrichum fioriniae PJ7 TaxID=1445577 RepID=A0A010RWI7_9PEZI|nr:hypothetical protein CFIO01_02124 [Colletotrichum fioriniae PJ7]